MNATSLRLEGAPNFRDMGGYIAGDGRVVKFGQLFRSGESSRLSAADIARLQEVGAKLIVDLRSEKESAAVKALWPFAADTELIAANILADLRAGNQSLNGLLIDNPTPQGAATMMEMTYQVLPHALGPTLLKIAQRIVREDKLPVIFHCTVGRDRAGITAALLLHALGVPRDTIIADYLRTNVCINAKSIRDMTQAYLTQHQVALSQETLDILTFARIEHFHAAFRTIAVEYGTVDGYLQAIGIDADLQSGLRQRLLEPNKMRQGELT